MNAASGQALAPVFIVGCARSGTSILGETIAAHPRVVYLYEANTIWRRFFPDRDDDRLTPADCRDAAAIEGLRGALATVLEEGGGDVLVEKNPKHTLRIAFLDHVLPACRVLHIVRDARDTVASLMFRNRGREWGHLRVPGWSELLARYPEENHLRCAHQWLESVSIARREGMALGTGRYLELRYEDLVARPLETVEAALSLAGLQMTGEVREAAVKIQDLTAGSYHARRQVRHFVDNHARRVGRHAENLTAEQVADIMSVCGDLMRDLGYGDAAPPERQARR